MAKESIFNMFKKLNGSQFQNGGHYILLYVELTELNRFDYRFWGRFF